MFANPSCRVSSAMRSAPLSVYLLTENRRFLTTPTLGLHEASQNSYSNPLTFLTNFLTPTTSFLKFFRWIWAYSRLVNGGGSLCRVFARAFAALKQASSDEYLLILKIIWNGRWSRRLPLTK